MHSLIGTLIFVFLFYFFLFSINFLIQRFANCTSLLRENLFEIERFFNATDYCTIFTKHDRQVSFRLKIAKPRKNTYFNKNMEKKTLFYKTKLHVEFNVDDKKLNIE